MRAKTKIVTIGEGGFIKLSPDDLIRLGVEVGDYLDVEEVGYRHLRFYKAIPPEEDHTAPS